MEGLRVVLKNTFFSYWVDLFLSDLGFTERNDCIILLFQLVRELSRTVKGIILKFFDMGLKKHFTLNEYRVKLMST